MDRQRSSNAFFIILSVMLIGFAVNGFGQSVSEEAQKHMDRGFAEAEAATTDGDFRDAIKEFEAAIRLAPGWPDAYFNLGKVQEKIGLKEDALNNYKHYLELAPSAPDAGDVRKLVAKLQVELDKEAQLKRVYEMLASAVYGRNLTTTTCSVSDEKMQFVNGKLFVHNPMPAILSPSPQWIPVTVNERLYEYHYTYYFCDLTVSQTFGVPPHCPYDVSVKGEVTSLDPPQIKETKAEAAAWWTGANHLGHRPEVSETVCDIVRK